MLSLPAVAQWRKIWIFVQDFGSTKNFDFELKIAQNLQNLSFHNHGFMNNFDCFVSLCAVNSAALDVQIYDDIFQLVQVEKFDLILLL